MVPSQTSTKRKAQDDNPLSNAAKKAKLEAKGGASNKRKLLNAEEQPGGLRIVRTPSIAPRLTSEPPSSIPPRPPSSQSQRPPSSADAGPSRQPSKKLRSDSQPPTSRTKPGSRSHERGVTPSTQEDLEIEKDVRAMEDEADHLRRNSRAHTMIDPSFMSANPEFQFPPRPPDSDTPRKGKSRIIDISVPLPSEETPQIERNKLLREGAMAAIANGRSRQQVQSNGVAGGHRRKSSVSTRGKRISSSFEATGVITQPHGSVSEHSFYKHIDCDLPDSERVRQLLIWCASRAAYGASDTPSKSRSAPQPEPKPQEPLPPLSTDDVLLLKKAQEDVIRMLAERKIDLSLYTPEASGSGSGTKETLKENDQNVTNRNWEIKYGNDIQRAVEEDEAWRKTGYAYDTYLKKGRTELEKRLSVSQQRKEILTPSEKAKGKQRATELDNWRPREHELSESFRHGVGLANSVLGIRAVGDQRLAGSSSRRRVTTDTGMGNEEMEAELARRIPEMEFKMDHLYSLASTVRTTLDVIERTLDQRFELLNLHLTARSGLPRPVHDPGSGSSAQILSTYVKQDAGMTGPDAMDVMRALAMVDIERPPGMVGDAARRAVREVQRAGENGAAGERRLTGVPPSSGLTPRKVPGTPRRGGTPGRERERER